jgi:hypothetical protein
VAHVATSILQSLKVPPGLPISRFRERPTVAVPPGSELPLIDKATTPEKRIQEIWNAKVRVFDLSKEEQLKEYEAVWQDVCLGKCMVSEHKTEFHNGTYIALLRWAALEYRLPTQV